MSMTPQQIRAFVLAGNALFTLKSLRTQMHFTFKVQQRMRVDLMTGKQFVASPPAWTVKVLNGPDNSRNYRAIGSLYPGDPIERFVTGSTAEERPLSAKAFAWCWENLDRCGERFEFHHAGRCGRCARLLTVPSSIESGIGPECADKLALGAMMDQFFGVGG